MNAATIHPHRPLLPIFSVLVAGAAAALGAVAIATDDVGSVMPQPAAATAAPNPNPAGTQRPADVCTSAPVVRC